ncbi:hypothetical protein AVEN_178945-1 [Araneus ventricosus]|uniref:Uncharacterized protein n=1 Tax=Araneus ventricosus TaxID=182803 RepID=A0A4Y2RKQ8_ARAVE|nr:hypothetical protein AVEN_178945-1 [Araneus ventricosus]
MSSASASGFYDWKHMHQQLSAHKKSSNHMKSYKICVEFSKIIRLGRTINSENQKETKMKVGHWREVFKPLVHVVVFPKEKRGKKNVTILKKQWRLLKLLAFIRKFCVVIAVHSRRAASDESYIHYREKTIKNEIIGLHRSKIEEQILKEVSNWAYYSKSLDCTPSHVGLMTSILLKFERQQTVYVISKMFQSENIDVSSAVEMMDKSRQAMVEMRSDKGIQHILVAAHALRNSIETKAEFQEPEVRPLKKKKQYGYESLDEAPP